MKFLKVITSAFYFVAEQRVCLTKALAWPFIASVLIDAASTLEVSGTLSVILVVTSIGVKSIFAITTHRVMLLGPESVSKWGITSWSIRETSYVLHILGLVAVVIGIFGLLMVIVSVVQIHAASTLVGVVALFIIAWLGGRFSLVFPGIATDGDVTFSQSWELTRGYQALMFLVVIGFPVLLAGPIYILEFVPYIPFLSSLAPAVIIVFEVAALSMAYQLITTEESCNC